MLDLSIIVPVFNVDKYLSGCIESVLKQKLNEDAFEIIIIDDESTDDSLKIAKRYEATNLNIRVISQKNKGLGGARNTGLQYACGEYVLFLDSDDSLVPNSIQLILDRIKKDDLDLLRFNYESVLEDGSILTKKKNSLYSIGYSNSLFWGEEFLYSQLGWACYAWQFIIKRDFLISNALYFNESIYFEDVEWLVRVLLQAKRVSSIDHCVYNYLQRQGSITRSLERRKQEKLYDDKLYILNFLQEIGKTTRNKGVGKWCKGLQALSIIGLFPFVKQLLPDKSSEFLTMINTNGFRPLVPYRFTYKQWRDIILINISPSLFYKLKS